MTSSRSETIAHQKLKAAALLWARQQCYDVSALEVRIPRSSYRADAVALRTTLKGGARVLRTVIFECKQSRADLIKDSRMVQDTKRRLAELFERKNTLDRLLGTHYPSLRTSEELFADFVVPVDPSSLGHEGYLSVTSEIEVLQRRLYGKTKFDRLMRYQNADLHYLVTTPGILEIHELPAGWGHLQAQDVATDEWTLSEKSPPLLCNPDPNARTELLIAVARKRGSTLVP